jgi:hypothetical protein
MTEEKIVTEQPKVGFEDEFWNRAASFNLKRGSVQIPSDMNSEKIDEFLSKVMQEKMKLPCKVSGKSICITLPARGCT